MFKYNLLFNKFKNEIITVRKLINVRKKEKN